MTRFVYRRPAGARELTVMRYEFAIRNKMAAFPLQEGVFTPGSTP